jgi:hypothetical protein
MHTRGSKLWLFCSSTTMYETSTDEHEHAYEYETSADRTIRDRFVTLIVIVRMLVLVR